MLGKIRLRLDPWPAEYEGAVQISQVEEAAGGEIDPFVETSDWRPIVAPTLREPARLHFVDGVRRIEARVLTDSPGTLVHGLFGSFAAGSVSASVSENENAGARFEKIEVGRGLILGEKIQTPPVKLAIGNLVLRFEADSYDGNSPADALARLQYLMRQAEAKLAEEGASAATVTFADGPLTYFSASCKEAIGVVKRIFNPYLGAEHFALTRHLGESDRTPLFSISDGKNDRYSWFLRVAKARKLDHPLAGIIRLEIRAAAGLDRAVKLAGEAAAWLPRFASDAIRDPRSPQNLLPVGALERELSRRMGDSLLIRRAIERKLFEELAA